MEEREDFKTTIEIQVRLLMTTLHLGVQNIFERISPASLELLIETSVAQKVN